MSSIKFYYSINLWNTETKFKIVETNNNVFENNNNFIDYISRDKEINKRLAKQIAEKFQSRILSDKLKKRRITRILQQHYHDKNKTTTLS